MTEQSSERLSDIPGSRTLASRLAREIEQEIVRRGWPVGEGLGSEAALMTRYQVGRSVLREAIRILESRWVAKPRPGPGGGLVVTAPDPDGVRDVTRVFLDFARVQPEHLYQAWMALEVVAVGELAARIDDQGIQRLRHALATDDATTGLHIEIAKLSGNPALELFIRVLIDLARHPAATAHPDDTHPNIVDAIISGDAALAQHHTRRCIQGLAAAAATSAPVVAHQLGQAR